MVEPEEWITTAEGLDNDHRTEQASLDTHKRTRVPQYSSIHIFQPFLTMTLRKLFPNYDLEVAKAGGRWVIKFPLSTGTVLIRLLQHS